MFCKYRNVLGEPGKGVNQYRLFHLAIVDVLLTILLALLIHRFYPSQNIFLILLAVFLLGILVHRLFCVNTAINKLLFGVIKP